MYFLKLIEICSISRSLVIQTGILFCRYYIYARHFICMLCTSPIWRFVCEMYLTKCICKSHNARQSSNVTVMCIHYTCPPGGILITTHRFTITCALYLMMFYITTTIYILYKDLNYKCINLLQNLCSKCNGTRQ